VQEVNLLSEEMAPQSEAVTLKDFGIAWALLVALLTAVSCWQAYSNWQLEKTAATARKDIQLVNAEIAALQARGVPQADAALLQELKALSDDRNDQLKLVEVLEREPINKGFQNHLEGLARIDMRPIWFESIRFDEGGRKIYLSGYSETAELVPVYLAQLSEGGTFSGYEFDGLKIERESDVLVAFEVHGPSGDAVND
jgi:hypothetical protein